MKQYRIIASGRVQGVFFRHNTKKIAMNLNLVGWVRNLDKGDVEILVQGKEEDIKRFIRECKNNPGSSQVDNLNIEKQDIQERFTDFENLKSESTRPYYLEKIYMEKKL